MSYNLKTMICFRRLALSKHVFYATIAYREWQNPESATRLQLSHDERALGTEQARQKLEEADKALKEHLLICELCRGEPT